MLSFERVGELLDQIAEAFPPAFYQALNGGILLLPETRLDDRTDGQLYVMGEYCHNQMGRYINLYYGSFAAVLGDEPEEVWDDELYATLAHEFTHHIESLAGERGLERKDAALLEEYCDRRREGG